MRRNIILVLVIATALLCAVTFTHSLAARQRSPMHQLARSIPERTFAARLSIRTEYHACTLPEKRDEPVQQEVCAEAQEGPLSPGVLLASRESSDPDSLQAWALATVIWWDEKGASLDDAILRLEKALRLSPNSVPLLVDLSAAHLVRAERTWNSRDLIQALNYAREALARKPRNAAARFNAALALQAFGLDWEADKAWSAYLRIDRNSEWADEARERRGWLPSHAAETSEPVPGTPDSVVEAFAAKYPQQAREMGWDSVLSEWGAAVEARKVARADSLLDFAERLGRGLAQRPGRDASLADAVRAIRRAAGDAAATVAIARAHQAYAAGRAGIKAVNYSEAADAFARVVSHQPASPVLVQWATTFLAATEHDTLTLLRLLPAVDSTHRALAGRTRINLGRELLTAGKYSDARMQYGAAAKLFRSAGEIESSAQALSGDGEAAYELGDTVEAYRLMHRVQLALRVSSTQPRHANLIALAERAVQDGMPRAALSIYDESVRTAKRTDSNVNAVEALQYRSRAAAIVGDSVGSARDLDSAVVWAHGLPAGAEERRLVDAMIRMVRPGRLSAAEMDTTVAAVSDNVLWLIPALLWRADAELAGKNVPAAIRYLDSVTVLIRGFSSKESHIRLRAAMIEQARGRFDQLVMLRLRQNRRDEALRVLERGRVSFAPQRDNGHSPTPGRSVPPPGQIVVDYALIGDTLVAWLIRPGSPIQVVSSRVDRDRFLLTVEQVGAALESSGRAEADPPGLRLLYDWLIGPIRNHLGPVDTPLVIVADGEVASVPFEALWDEDRDRYLVEDHPLRFAPTLADAVRPSPSGRTRSRMVLLVADPAFDGLRHFAWVRLPGARTEVDSLASFYPDAEVLRDRSATRDAFAALAQRAGIIHYAGHAVFDDARPERSYLLLAGADTTGRLTAQALDSMELRGAPLVVLSACRTLRSREGRSGGFAGLSGSLLTAGASGVVGSLWQADDELTQPLMRAFHSHYRRLRDPALALREAQRDMIRSGNLEQRSPAAWAGFRYMGN